MGVPAEKAMKGEPIGCAPVGYRNVWTEEGKRIEIDPETAPLIKEAFQMATRVRTSLDRILKELTPKGLVSRSGKPMGTSALHSILTNPFYVGKRPYKGQIYDGVHPPLVSQRMFDQVQERLKERRRREFRSVPS